MAKGKQTSTVQEVKTSSFFDGMNPYLEASVWFVGIFLFFFLMRRYRRGLNRIALLVRVIGAFAFLGSLTIGAIVFVFDVTTGLPSRLVGYPIGWNFYGNLGRVAFIGFILLMLWEGLEKIKRWFGPGAPMTTRERIRGRELLNFERVKELAANYRGPSWGFVDLPHESATQHFAAIGSTGSGKTMLLRLLMQSVLPHIKEGSDSRALIYDAKADILPILDGMGVNAPIWILNPFDERSAAWEMGVDVTAPATAQHIATILISPAKNESQPFFTDAARALLTGVMISFMKRSPGKWLLSDVIHATRTTQALSEVLSATEETKYLVNQYLNEGITANNILSSLATKLQPFEFIAAAWDRAERKISLRDWVASESILVLGNDEAVRSALDSINRVIFRRIVELTLAESESATRRTWFFLDELRQAGALDGLNNLLTAGRSKGACVVVGAQDIEGLREVYGENKANELLGLCGHKAVLRLDSPITAKWASELFGTVEDFETRLSHSSGTSESLGHSNTSSGSQTSEQHVVRDVVLPSEFLSLPFPNRSKGMIGYYLSPEFGGAGYRAHISGDWIAGALSPLGDAPSVLPRSEDHQFLSAWSETRRAELGLETKVSSLSSQRDRPEDNLDNLLDEVLAESKGRKSETNK